MGERIKFTRAESDEIRRKFHKKRLIKNVYGYRRVQALYLRTQGKTNKEIGEICGYCEQFVTELVAEYRAVGIEEIIKDKRTTNNRRLSREAESEMLEGFRGIAAAGQLITAEDILRKYEELTGRESNISTIYKLLKRHGWRKVKPRPEHPGSASEEEREASKKLTQNGRTYSWTSGTQT